MNTNLLFEEIKRLHEIMGVSPKNVILESVGQPWFESLMKDVIERASRSMDGTSDEVMDGAAYDAIKPWIAKEFNLSNPKPEDIDSFLKTISDDLSSGKSLSSVGQNMNWYSLLDDLVKRNDSFYTKLIDDMINSGDFKEVSDLLKSTIDAKEILKLGKDVNPEIYNDTIDALTNLKSAIQNSNMDGQLKKIISDEFELGNIPMKSKVPLRDEVFSKIASEIRFKDIPYKNLKKIYELAKNNPESLISKINQSTEYFEKYVVKSDSRFLGKFSPTGFFNRVKTALNVYEKLWKLGEKDPGYFKYVIASWLVAASSICELYKLIKLGYQFTEAGDREMFEFINGEIGDIVVNDFYNCTLNAPFETIKFIINYTDENVILRPGDETVKNKLNELLSKGDNTNYLKYAQSLIDNSNATADDFKNAGLPTDGLNFNKNKSEGGLYKENLNNFKDYLTKSGIELKNPINDTANSGFWSNDSKNYVFVVSNEETGEGTWNPNK